MASPARHLVPAAATPDPGPVGEDRAAPRPTETSPARRALGAVAARARTEAERDGARIVAESEVPAGGE